MWRVSSFWTQISERIWKGKLVKFFIFNRLTISTEVAAALLVGQFYDVILEVVPEKQCSDESDPVTWMRSVLIIKVILEVSSWGFSGDASGKEPPCKCRRLRRRKRCSFPGSGRSPVAGNGSSLQYSCLENPMNRGAWWATVRGVTKRYDWATKHSTAQQSGMGNW